MSEQKLQLDTDLRIWNVDEMTARMEQMEQEILVTLRNMIDEGRQPTVLFMDKVFKRYLNTDGPVMLGTNISVVYGHFEDRRDTPLYDIWTRDSLETILARLDA